MELKKYKIIFLDMDGVVNTVNSDKYSLGLRLAYDYDNYKDNFYFDPRILINFIKLLDFCKTNDVQICISSTWRMGTTVAGWNNFLYKHFRNSLRLKENDMLVVGITGNGCNGIRGLQIKEWLSSCKKDIDYLRSLQTKGWLSSCKEDIDYLVIDDEMFDIKDYISDDFLLQIDNKKGLTYKNLKEIEKYFVKKDETEKRTLEIGKIYKHFKGNLYKVLNLAKDTETNNDIVVYQALYGEKLIYTRELDMFLSEVDHEKYPEVEQRYRFELIGK